MWFLFDNESGLISQYDITFRRLQWAVDYVKPFLKPQLVEELGSLVDDCDDIDDLKHLRAAIDVCREHETYCHGADQQYESTQACIDFVYRNTPLGKVYEWGGNTGKLTFLNLTTFNAYESGLYAQPCVDIFTKVILQRTSASTISAHLFPAMIKYRPTVHCPHVGYVIINVF